MSSIIMCNILSVIFTISFIAFSFYFLHLDKDNNYGIIAKKGGKIIADGKQGTDFTIGTGVRNDHTLLIHGLEKYDALVTRGRKVISILFNKNCYTQGRTIIPPSVNEETEENEYRPENAISFEIGKIVNRINPIALGATLSCFLFTICRFFSLVCQYNFEKTTPSEAMGHTLLKTIVYLLIPFSVLFIYQIHVTRKAYNQIPVIDYAFTMLLSYHISATIYLANAGNFEKKIQSALISVLAYVGFATLAKHYTLYWRHTDTFNLKRIFNSLFGKKIEITPYVADGERLRGQTFYYNDLYRLICLLGIIALIIINVIFAKEVNGAKNWVKIGPLPQFQPGEIVKLLLMIIVVIPCNEFSLDKFHLLVNQKHKAENGKIENKIYSFVIFKDFFYLIIVPFICVIYTLYIGDVGALLEMAIIWIAALVMQSNLLRVFIPFIIAASAVAVKIISVIDSTSAKGRIKEWKGSDEFTFFERLCGRGVFSNTLIHQGNQCSRALAAAFKNGGLFGRHYDDLSIQSHIEAANSDIVLTMIGEDYGVLNMILVAFLFVLIAYASFAMIKRKTNLQQKLGAISAALVSFAFVINWGGTAGVVPLTGVVLPAVSDGTTAAIIFGSAFGFMSSQSYALRNTKKERKEKFKKYIGIFADESKKMLTEENPTGQSEDADVNNNEIIKEGE